MKTRAWTTKALVPARERLRRHMRGIARAGCWMVGAAAVVLVPVVSHMHTNWPPLPFSLATVLLVRWLAKLTLVVGVAVLLYAMATLVYRRANRERLWRRLRGLGHEWATVEDAEWLLLKMPRAAWHLPRAEDVHVPPWVPSGVDSLVECARMQREREAQAAATTFVPARERLRRHGRGVATAGYWTVGAPTVVLVLLASWMWATEPPLFSPPMLAAVLVGCLAEMTLAGGLLVLIGSMAMFLYRRARRGRLHRLLLDSGYEWATEDDAEWLLLKLPRAAWRMPRAEDACVLPGVSSDVDGLVAYDRMQREREREARRQK